MSSRESFLSRVRDAVKAGNTAGAAAPIPERGNVGYQGGGPNPLAKFIEFSQLMGMKTQTVTSRDDLFAKIAAILDAKAARKILVGQMDSLDIAAWVRSTGREVIAANEPKARTFTADASITGVAGLIAETGSLVIAASPTMTRSESLIAPLHIAIVRPEQIENDVFDVLGTYSASNLPASNLVFISGPSKTGDIEMKLVTGVHGPGEVHILVLV